MAPGFTTIAANLHPYFQLFVCMNTWIHTYTKTCIASGKTDKLGWFWTWKVNIIKFTVIITHLNLVVNSLTLLIAVTAYTKLLVFNNHILNEMWVNNAMKLKQSSQQWQLQTSMYLVTKVQMTRLESSSAGEIKAKMGLSVFSSFRHLTRMSNASLLLP